MAFLDCHKSTQSVDVGIANNSRNDRIFIFRKASKRQMCFIKLDNDRLKLYNAISINLFYKIHIKDCK